MSIAAIEFPDWLQPVVIPGLPIRWYGVMYLVAFAVTFALVRFELTQRRDAPSLSLDDTVNLFFWTIVGLLVGARVVSAVVYDPTRAWLSRPWTILWPFDAQMNFVGLQGMSYHGGLVGAVVAFVVYCRVKRWDTLRLGDILATAVPLGYTFGRIGNFINQELYGRATALPWGVIFPDAERIPAAHPAAERIATAAGIEPVGALVNLPRHPSQLYEAALEGVLLWLVLAFMIRPRVVARGAMIGWYLLGYAIARFVAEYFRTPDPGLDFVVQLGPADNPPWLLLSPLNLTTGQIFSVGMALVGIAVLAAARSFYRKRPTVEVFEKPEERG